jgi:hypothetical protein
MGRLAGGVFAAFDDDDFRWWIGRQADAGDAAGVHRTMGHHDRQGVNAWFAARDARNEVGDYAGDLDRAWELADAAAGSVEAAGLQCRYALLRALLGDLGFRFQPDLAALLVRHGVWTREQALAWGRLNLDPQSALDLIADAIDEAQGTRREQLVSLALATSSQMVSSDDRTLRLAAMARTAAPHEQAALLDSIVAEANSGSRLGGLRAVIPHLPTELLARARTAAWSFESAELRAEALTAVAHALPPEEQHDAYIEVLATAREELAGTRATHSVETPGVRLLATLAATLPVALLGRLLDLAREAELTGYDYERVIGAVSCRLAETDPAGAVRRAEKLSTGPRDEVLAAAARAHTRAGRIAEAIAAAAEIKVELVRAPALEAIASQLADVEDPALLDQVRRLSPHYRIEVVRALAARADRPTPTLLAVADAMPEQRDRLRARAAMASALTSAEVAATLAALSAADDLDAGALAELAPRLAIGQARTALDRLTDPDLTDWDAVIALAVRLVELGAPDEALARVADITDPPQLKRPEALATLARHLPERLLPAVPAAVQPSAPAEERVAARTALLAHLPSSRAGDVIAQAAALDHPTRRAQALAPLVAAGHTAAEPLLITALRDSNASRHLDRYEIALQAVRTVAAAGVALSEQLVVAAQELPSAHYRMLALLALARSGRTAAARSASAAVVDLLLAGESIDEIPDGMIEDADTTCLAEAVLAVPDAEAFAAVVVDLVPLLHERDRGAVLSRASTIQAHLPRLLALSMLSHAPPDVAGPIAAAEHARLDQWSGEGYSDPELLPLGLQVLVAGGIEPDQELVERAWEAFSDLDDPTRWLAHITTLAELPDTAVPAVLVTDVLNTALHLDTEWRWPALAALAPRLGADDIAWTLPVLRKAEPGDEAAVQAAADCAVRAAELGDEPLMLAYLAAVSDFLDLRPAVAAAAERLPSGVLRTIADHAAQDPDALAAIAVSAATHNDHRLALDILSRITSSSSREKAVTGVAERAQPSWADALLALIRELSEGPRAEALAALVPRVAPERRAPLVEEAVRAAQGYRHASAPRRRRILSALATELARLPPAQVAQLWIDDMRATGLRGRDEVLVDVAALADPLMKVFGSPVALALDDAIQVGGPDRWP